MLSGRRSYSRQCRYVHSVVSQFRSYVNVRWLCLQTRSTGRYPEATWCWSINTLQLACPVDLWLCHPLWISCDLRLLLIWRISRNASPASCLYRMDFGFRSLDVYGHLFDCIKQARVIFYHLNDRISLNYVSPIHQAGLFPPLPWCGSQIQRSCKIQDRPMDRVSDILLRINLAAC